jgi:ribosomal protein S18 acetylase RimI-like enzyme
MPRKPAIAQPPPPAFSGPRVLHAQPSAHDRSGEPFVQTLSLELAGRVVGTARWFAPATSHVAQILDLRVDPSMQRRGHGTALLQAVYTQCAAVGAARGSRIRLVWCIVEQKGHIRFRGFLFKHGFHHVSTHKRLYRDDDAMLYVKAFD